MKLQWTGFAHGTEPLDYDYDNFGLADGQSLNFRTDAETDTGRGSAHRNPVMAVMSVGNPCADHPASASRLVVRNLIHSFRNECRTKQFTELNYDRWLKFQFSQIHKKMLMHGQENPEYSGFSASCTCVILHGDLAHIAQLGNTRLLRLREGSVMDLSVGESIESPPEEYAFENPRSIRTEGKTYLNGMLGVTDGSYIEPHFYFSDIQKKDILAFCTNGVEIAIGPRGFESFFSRVWNSFNFKKACRQMMTEGVRLCNDACVGTLFLRIA